jgi:DNA-binding LacI/PurR family transcriptional regulator
MMAVGLLRAFTEAGIRVPAGISIGSFGDLPWARLLTPSLTTVRQDFAQVGLSGFGCLMNLLENPGSPLLQIELEPELKIRESTAPPAPASTGRRLKKNASRAHGGNPGPLS